MPARLNIKHAVAFCAATRLAEMTGETKKAVVMALRGALERLATIPTGGDLARPDGTAAPELWR